MKNIEDYEKLKEFSNSSLIKQRVKAAECNLADEDILLKLSKDNARVVRIAVISNDNVSNDVLIKMFLKEEDEHVIVHLVNKMIERNIAKIIN